MFSQMTKLAIIPCTVVLEVLFFAKKFRSFIYPLAIIVQLFFLSSKCIMIARTKTNCKVVWCLSNCFLYLFLKIIFKLKPYLVAHTPPWFKNVIQCIQVLSHWILRDGVFQRFIYFDCISSNEFLYYYPSNNVVLYYYFPLVCPCFRVYISHLLQSLIGFQQFFV